MLDDPKREVHCDAGCGDSIVLSLSNNEQFKKDLKNAGWLLKGNKHYCSELCFEMAKQIEAVQLHPNKR